MEFHYGENSFLTYYTPVEGVASEASPAADWRIVIMVPTSVVARDILAAFKGVQTTLFALLAIICIILIFVIAVYGRIIRKNKLLKYTDPVTGNINQERFRIDAGRLLHDGNGRYAIVSMNILRFKYVNEQVGREVADEILADVLRVTASFLREDELTARGYADRFLILLRSDVEDLSRRLQELYKKLSETSYARGAVSLKFTMGVYEMPDASEISLSSGIDRARLAAALHGGIISRKIHRPLRRQYARQGDGGGRPRTTGGTGARQGTVRGLLSVKAQHSPRRMVRKRGAGALDGSPCGA